MAVVSLNLYCGLELTECSIIGSHIHVSPAVAASARAQLADARPLALKFTKYLVTFVAGPSTYTTFLTLSGGMDQVQRYIDSHRSLARGFFGCGGKTIPVEYDSVLIEVAEDQ